MRCRVSPASLCLAVAYVLHLAVASQVAQRGEVATVFVSDTAELRAALQGSGPTPRTILVAADAIRLCGSPPCAPLTLDSEVTLAAAPGFDHPSLDATAAGPVTVATNGTLTLQGLTLTAAAPGVARGHDSLFPAFLSVAGSGSVDMRDCQVVTSGAVAPPDPLHEWDVTTAATYADGTPSLIEYAPFSLDAASAANHPSLSLSPPDSPPWSGTWTVTASASLHDLNACFTSGRFIVDAAAFKAAVAAAAPRLYLPQDLTSSRADFPDTPEGAAVQLRANDTLIYGCNGVRWDLGLLQGRVELLPGTTLRLKGDIVFDRVDVQSRDYWIPNEPFFLSLFSIPIGTDATVLMEGITIRARAASQTMSRDSPLWAADRTALQPSIQAQPSAREVLIASWDVSRPDVVAAYLGQEPSVSEKADPDRWEARWAGANVRLVDLDVDVCATPGWSVRTAAQLKAGLMDPEITTIHVLEDIDMTQVEWPAPDMEKSDDPNFGIQLRHPLQIHACKGGDMVRWDLGDIGQTVYVFTGGMLHIEGPFNITGAKTTLRRGMLSSLLGFFSVEEDGVMLLSGCTVSSSVVDPVQDPSHSWWETSPPVVQPVEGVNLLPGPNGALTPTAHIPFWRFRASDWILATDGELLDSQGYWQFIDHTVEVLVQPESSSRSRVLYLVFGLLGGGALLLCGLCGLASYCWRVRPFDRKGSNLVGSSSQSNTALMISTVHNPEDRIKAAQRTLSGRVEGETFMKASDGDIVILGLLGRGSFGRVYKGLWRGSIVAVKTMMLPGPTSGAERLRRMAIMETAISASVSHPNIVQTYTYQVRQVEKAPSDSPAAATPEADGGGGGVLPGGADLWEVRLVLEHCDMGTLRQAVDDARFHRDGLCLLDAVLLTAIEIARALLHLHQENIIHADLKARNVLLRSQGSDPRGFSVRVADFGLALHIGPDDSHVSGVHQGTLTHMAPEVLMNGKLSKSCDVYAFGIILWELYTGQHAFQGTPIALLGHAITKLNLRPEFPVMCPFEYQLLACRCWEPDPAARPTFQEIQQELDVIFEMLRSKIAGGVSPP